MNFSIAKLIKRALREKSQSKKTLIVVLVFCLSYPLHLLAASATSVVQMTVLKPLTIEQVSNLEFPEAAAGSEAFEVDPGEMESGNNASFLVSGEANMAFNIVLPNDGDVNLSNPQQLEQKIAVTGFKSYPAAGSNGLIGENGQQKIFVGARRAQLSQQQTPGYYVDSFVVEIVY